MEFGIFAVLVLAIHIKNIHCERFVYGPVGTSDYYGYEDGNSIATFGIRRHNLVKSKSGGSFDFDVDESCYENEPMNWYCSGSDCVCLLPWNANKVSNKPACYKQGFEGGALYIIRNAKDKAQILTSSAYLNPNDNIVTQTDTGMVGQQRWRAHRGKDGWYLMVNHGSQCHYKFVMADSQSQPSKATIMAKTCDIWQQWDAEPVPKADACSGTVFIRSLKSGMHLSFMSPGAPTQMIPRSPENQNTWWILEKVTANASTQG